MLVFAQYSQTDFLKFKSRLLLTIKRVFMKLFELVSMEADFNDFLEGTCP